MLWKTEKHLSIFRLQLSGISNKCSHTRKKIEIDCDYGILNFFSQIHRCVMHFRKHLIKNYANYLSNYAIFEFSKNCDIKQNQNKKHMYRYDSQLYGNTFRLQLYFFGVNSNLTELYKIPQTEMS